MMNKYLVAMPVAFILISFLFTPYRSIYRNRSFFGAAAIALLIMLPNIVWQISHNLPVLTHLRALHDSQLVHVNRFSFFTDQLLLGSFAMVLVIPGIIFSLSSRTLRPFRPVIIASLLVVLCLAVLRGKSYYTAGILPLWIAAGGVFWEKAAVRKVPRLIIPLLMILPTLPILPMGIPVLKPARLASYFAGIRDATGFDAVLRWETGKIHALPQDYADMLGWEEIADNTARAWRMVPDKKAAMIYAENYGQAGAVMVLGKKYGLPEPACFSESFYYWIPRNPVTGITTLIYINDEMGSDVKELFGSIRLIGKVGNPLAREYGTGVWLCTGPLRSFNAFWNERVPLVKSPFE
jgi:hypothetical protein